MKTPAMLTCYHVIFTYNTSKTYQILSNNIVLLPIADERGIHITTPPPPSTYNPPNWWRKTSLRRQEEWPSTAESRQHHRRRRWKLYNNNNVASAPMRGGGVYHESGRHFLIPLAAATDTVCSWISSARVTVFGLLLLHVHWPTFK